MFIQSCYYFTNGDTRKREIGGILETSKFFNCSNLLIMTYDHEEEIKSDNRIVRVVPAWKAMLDEKF